MIDTNTKVTMMVRVTPKVKAKLEALAINDKRSLSNYVELLLTELLELVEYKNNSNY